MKKEMDCMICGVKTSSMGTGLCDNCWEFERRIPRTRKELKRKLDKVFQYRIDQIIQANSADKDETGPNEDS